MPPPQVLFFPSIFYTSCRANTICHLRKVQQNFHKLRAERVWADNPAQDETHHVSKEENDYLVNMERNSVIHISYFWSKKRSTTLILTCQPAIHSHSFRRTHPGWRTIMFLPTVDTKWQTQNEILHLETKHEVMAGQLRSI